MSASSSRRTPAPTSRHAPELNWLASTITDAVLEVLANDEDTVVADRHITSLLGFIRLGADAFLPQRV